MVMMKNVKRIRTREEVFSKCFLILITLFLIALCLMLGIWAYVKDGSVWLLAIWLALAVIIIVVVVPRLLMMKE
jgi:membrane protein YdbS with pleckstrin-like domain